MTDDIMYILIFMFKQKRRKKPVHILTVRQFRQAIRVCFFKLLENESLRFNIWDFRKQPFHSVHSKPDHQSVLPYETCRFTIEAKMPFCFNSSSKVPLSATRP